MLVLSLLLAAASAAEPTLDLTWRGASAELMVTPPAGEHVNADAPAELTADWAGKHAAITGPGASILGGLALNDVGGTTLSAILRVSLCTNDGATCRSVDLHARATPPASRKGHLTLAPTGAHDDASPFRADAQAAYDAAVDEARDTGRLLLLDFSAVWCPPCNLMSAEVLHAEPAPEELEDYVVVVLDVDDPSSWALKDRHHIGSYPTVVVTDVDGDELSRNVGYDTPEALRAWLAESATAPSGSGDEAAVDPASVSPEEAGEIAWRLIRRDQGDPTAWLDRASLAPNTVPFRLARVSHAPSVEDIQWLAANAPERGLSWVFPAAELIKTQDDAKSPLLYAIRRALSTASGPQAADLLYLAATMSDDAQGPLLYAGAAAALRASLSGDAQRDRGYWTWLAELEAHSGDLSNALAILEDASAAFPDEPTFWLAESALLLDAERPEDALAAADRAMPLAWGDNRLRVALARVDALVALNRLDEAQSFAERVLAEVPAPPEGLEVRAHRYRHQLREHAKLP